MQDKIPGAIYAWNVVCISGSNSSHSIFKLVMAAHLNLGCYAVANGIIKFKTSPGFILYRS